MRVDIGPFGLDEPGRALWLGNREIPMQPRVFDLLVYLVRNSDRVVSKDELLDTLWPGVIVTDNSLQRAVSTLRGVLRAGGMEDAIRSFPRAGYRFAADAGRPMVAASPQPAADVPQNVLDAARQAVADQRWDEANGLFSAADEQTALQTQDLDHWAVAIQCLGRPSDAIPILVRAVGSYTASGQNLAAAESAVSLVTLHLERGDGAIAKGWLARAKDLARDDPQSVSSGMVLWICSRMAAIECKPEEALGFASAAYELGRRCGSPRVETLGLMFRGFFKLSLGETMAGLADQDHAAALSLSANIDTITSSTLYCNILWACRTFGDWARANQWTAGYQNFCRKSGMGFSGSCQLHRAEVVAIQGSLQDALDHINDALSRLSDDAPWSIGDAHRVLGDIHAAIGNTGAASAAYEKCYALGWDPEPGNAMLMLDLGQAEAAYASLERSLIGQSWWTLQRRGLLLAHLAYVAAHVGRYEKAQSLIDELAGDAERWPMPSLRALTNEASALIARRQRGDAAEALRYLHLARQLWTSVNSRLNATRVRLEIAALQLDVGEIPGAAAEIRAASTMARDLGSEKLNARVAELQRRI